MRSLSHRGGGAAYLSPEVPFSLERLRQSQTTCIILAAWVHAQESWIPSSSLRPQIIHLIIHLSYSPYKTIFHAVHEFPCCLALSLPEVSDKRSGESKPTFPDPPLHSEPVETLAVMSVRTCSFSEREHVCSNKCPSPCVPLRRWPSCGTWPSGDSLLPRMPRHRPESVDSRPHNLSYL